MREVRRRLAYLREVPQGGSVLPLLPYVPAWVLMRSAHNPTYQSAADDRVAETVPQEGGARALHRLRVATEYDCGEGALLPGALRRNEQEDESGKGKGVCP